MSTLIVEICRIEEVLKHPNADKLDLVQVKGWSCVTSKDSFKVGDLALYIPIDSVLPEELENKIFKDSKIKLDKHRIRTIKLRKIISQGLVVKPEDIGIYNYKLSQDFTSTLGIMKYEPPEELPNAYGVCNKIKKMYINSNFKKYIDIQNIKNYPSVFQDGEQVYISEKIHGTSVRMGWVENEANTIWKKIKRFLGLLPKYEFIVGSRNIQLTYGNKDKTFYKENVYTKTAEMLDLKNKLKFGEVLYGEIVGDGIQKGYGYACRPGTTAFYAYDVMKDDKFLDYEDFRNFCKERGIRPVPLLYIGPYSKETVKEHTIGASTIDTIGTPIREGCVTKSFKEQNSPYIGRKVLKSISEDYLLLKDNSDFH